MKHKKFNNKENDKDILAKGSPARDESARASRALDKKDYIQVLKTGNSYRFFQVKI